MDTQKKCTLCKKYLDLSYFYKDIYRRDGLANKCKECCRIYSKKYYARTKAVAVAKANGTYNSKLHASIVNRRNAKCNYYKNPKRCKACNALIMYNKKRQSFCNNTCAVFYNSVLKSKRKDISLSRAGIKKLIKNKIVNHCACCGKPLDSRRTFCNTTCKAEYSYLIYINKWLSGQVDGIIRGNSGATNRYIKRYLREKYGNECQECGWSKVNTITKNVPIQLEHIDGNWKNNKEENLKLLCPNCHSLTHTFGSLNVGNGRTLSPLDSTI